VADEQFLAAKSVVDVPDEQSGMPVVATLADFDGEPPASTLSGPPRRGAHTGDPD
jgi:crotonobetainyl-CoA:carnitine CoA-transferase CaiB-like acyl-CoA transferase